MVTLVEATQVELSKLLLVRFHKEKLFVPLFFVYIRILSVQHVAGRHYQQQLSCDSKVSLQLSCKEESFRLSCGMLLCERFQPLPFPALQIIRNTQVVCRLMVLSNEVHGRRETVPAASKSSGYCKTAHRAVISKPQRMVWMKIIRILTCK
ncbi:hypothetical protein CEXT_488211 [Caerostris extrusa]|uniref:Uncharacterized protein n=1 Tax=Caerostris extrusa TaxID=172846 RepID=A0AAV4XKK8_CAEEX|nr:hypothetical protein CEXT_488211 [Caerostris extrusa]